MTIFLSALWFIRTTKVILFYLYLWQLKEYHIGRFIDHFRTAKGKQLLLNKALFLKIVLALIFLFSSALLPFIFKWNLFQNVLFFPFLLLIVYFFELAKWFLDFSRGKLKSPILTKKTGPILIFTLSLFVFILIFLWQTTQQNYLHYDTPFLHRFCFWLLVLDILTPAIISLIVLFFQPLAVLGRNQIIKKAKQKRSKFKEILVIGITGSYGKTSTKEFLAAILSEKFKVLKTKEHQNSEVGVSQCILNDLKPEHEIFVVEMGAYNRGGIKLLCEIAKPKIGILTGINEQHMATFGSLENIIKAKYELIESLPENGTAFFNAQNKYCLELYQQTKIKKKLYGEQAKFPGEENILGAMEVAKELGMTEEEISRACQKIENKMPGIQIQEGIDGLKVIDATYSANPDGVIVHLEYLKTLPGKKVMVMPCLIELGKASREVHKRIGKKIGEVCDLVILTTKDRFKEIKGGAVEKGMKEENILFLENPKEILEKIKSFTRPADIILLESRIPFQLKNFLLE